MFEASDCVLLITPFRFNRYPLIIDPSGQAINFLLKQFAGKNIQKTSFLDDSFR